MTTAAADPPLDEILAFWFAPSSRDRWFASDPDFDREIATRFGTLVEDAAAGRLGRWGETARGSLGLCLLLDQFPRNAWRGTPRAFAHDPAARAAASAALDRGHDRELDPEGRMFLYLPFEHSEDLDDQERCVALMAGLSNEEWLDYAVRHRDIIARFGRFPHRNRILGRPSTEAEIVFLREPGSSF
jgi:uncharacterized protein (DUF924 family)